MVTIIDVAREAGVSKTTASDALRGHGRVAADTRAAVEAAADRLGYRANRSARSLRTATAGAVGLYLPEARVRSEYYLEFMYGVVERCAASELDVVLSMAPERLATGAGVDGIVICDPRADDPAVGRILDAGVPVVTCEAVPGERQPDGVVWSDGRRWMRALLDRLADAGVARPALLGTTTQGAWALDVHETFSLWCAERGIEPRIERTVFSSRLSEVHGLATKLLASEPRIDALVCVADATASAVMPAISAAGRHPGGDLLVASCSEQSLPDDVHAVINTRGDAAGHRCADLLVDLLAGDAEPGTERELELEILQAS